MTKLPAVKLRGLPGSSGRNYPSNELFASSANLSKSFSNSRTVELKGLSTTTELVTIEWT